jgi:hypothetical protein
MRSVNALACAVAILFVALLPAKADTILAKVSISDQRMDVFVDGWPRYSWPVSTARPGY